MRRTNLHFNNFFLFILLLGIFACNNKNVDNSTSTSSIPDLLNRSEKIRNGIEWEEVQNQYQTLQVAILQKESDHESKIRLAHLFIREARVTGEHGHYYPAALKMTDWILNSKSKDMNMEFMALVTKATVQLSLHEFTDALATGQKALMFNNKNAQLYGVLTDAYVELGHYDNAIKMADIMISIKPDLRSYARISYLREIHGQIPEAIAAMRMAVEAGVPGYEDTAWAMLTLGELYERYGEPNKAKSIYQEILAMRPNYPFAVGALGALLIKDNKIEEAEVITNQAIEIIPEVGFYTQLAEIYKIQGRNAEMESLMKEIFAMLKDDVESGHNMNLEYAHIYLDLLEDTDLALEYAQKEYEKRPDNIDVNLMLAKIYKAQQNDTLVEKHIAAASITQSKHPELKKLLVNL